MDVGTVVDLTVVTVVVFDTNVLNVVACGVVVVGA